MITFASRNETPKLNRTITELHTFLNRLQHENINEFEFSAEATSVMNALDTIPEWWKEHYNIPGNDERWLMLTRETALEDYTKYIAGFTKKLIRDRYGIGNPEKATIMEKTGEELKQEIESVKNWIADGDEKLQQVITNTGKDKTTLEKELYGKELTREEKEDLVRERVLKMMREEYGMQV